MQIQSLILSMRSRAAELMHMLCGATDNKVYGFHILTDINVYVNTIVTIQIIVQNHSV